MAEIQLSTVARDDLDGFVTTMRRFFGQGRAADQKHVVDVLGIGTLAQLDGDDAGTCAIIDFRLTVPGGATVPMDGVTIVVVSPVHRRRGILRAMMQHMLEQARGRGAALMGLGATESVIYRRFGYGVASFSCQATIDTAHAAWRVPPTTSGRVRLVPMEDALPTWLDVESRSRRVGSLNRSEASWRRVIETETGRQPGPLLQVAVHEDGYGVVDGFVNYTTEVRWQNDCTDGLATAHQMCALTRDAHLALWDHLLRLDMMEHLVFERFWTDDPVQHLLADPRRLQYTPHDDLHLRIVDPLAALAARRYAREDSVVIEVRDARCPDLEGRYRVEGGLEGAQAHRTTVEADVVMDAAALGSVYLGDVSIAGLHAAGVVEEVRAGAVQRASAMFSWQPRPQLTYMF